MDSRALRKFSYGVYLVTTKDIEGKKAGCIINSAFQVTSTPVQLLLSINHENETCRAIKESRKVILNILDENVSMDLIKTFGYHSSKDTDKFHGQEEKEIDGLPFLLVGLAYFVLEVKDIFETSTHSLFLCEVKEMEQLKEAKEMTYAYFHEVKKGVAPKNAPTYQEVGKKSNDKHHFQCLVCGYIFETELDELPLDFHCPLCGTTRENFKKID